MSLAHKGTWVYGSVPCLLVVAANTLGPPDSVRKGWLGQLFPAAVSVGCEVGVRQDSGAVLKLRF